MWVGEQAHDALIRHAVRALDSPDASSPGPRAFDDSSREDEQLPATIARLRLVVPAHLLLQQWMSFSNLCIWFAMVFPLVTEYSRACR
jgi:hypothetical protein